MLDRSQIHAILPHRPPFLFVDSISEIVSGERIVGHFRVREDESFLGRDDPEGQESRATTGYLPATLLAEAMAQVGAILVLQPPENRGKTIYFRAIEQAEFLRRVPEGADIRVEAEVKKLRARFGVLGVEAFLESELLARAVMSFALGP